MKVFRSEKAKQQVYRTYDVLLKEWGIGYCELDVKTTYGSTHVIECGDTNKPTLILFHGVGDNSALMWIYNASEWSKYFHIFAIDTIGGPGKSCPNENYNKTFSQIQWIDEVLEMVHVSRAYMVGVSNGSYMVHHYGIERPEKVIKMICMSGSVSARGNKSPIRTMMIVFLPEAMIPTKHNIKRIIEKLSGENSQAFTKNPKIMEHFTYLLRGFNNMAMAYHRIEYFDEEQLKRLQGKTLFLCGESDPMGDITIVRERLKRYELDFQTFAGVGHGINHEISEKINKILITYFLGTSLE